ncbi:ABC transporter permease [Hominifimenecus sp. rT4P-3]|uniref:ABC transporter permease n=1 Tax=Hominifimenecus sp. rT4P-3 TaxID=3242979 RepID=UPI003DA4D7A8
MDKLSAAQQQFLSDAARHKRNIRIGRSLILVLLLVLWEGSVRLGWLNDFIFSSPCRLVSTFGTMASDGSIFMHIGITLAETIISFLLVTVLSLLIAMVLWKCTLAAEILEPYLVMLNSLPKSALAPVLIVWLGNNMKTIIVAAVSIAVFGSIITLLTGFKEVDEDKIKLILSLGGSNRDVMTKVMIPSSVALLVSTMKVNIGLCLVGVIIGEFLAARAGLGYLIIYGSQVFKMDYVILSIVILCIVSALLYKGISILEKRFG